MDFFASSWSASNEDMMEIEFWVNDEYVVITNTAYLLYGKYSNVGHIHS